MNEPDNTIVDPIVQLVAYGIPEHRVRDTQEILSKASTLEELKEEMIKRHASFDEFFNF